MEQLKEELKEELKIKMGTNSLNTMTSQKDIPTHMCVLFNYQKKTRPLLSVKVNKHEDTGTQSTLVDVRILTSVEKERVDKSIPINVIGVGGKTMPLFGVMECTFTMVKVIEDNTHKCILSMDILSRIKGLTFDFHTNALSIGPIKRKCNQALEEVAIIDVTITISPGRCILCLVTTSIPDNTMVIYMPNDRFEAKKLLLIPTIAPVVDDLVPVRISNWSTSPQRIYSGTKLGHIEIYNGKAAEQNCSITAEPVPQVEINPTHAPPPLKGKVYGKLKVTTPSLSDDQQRMFC